MASIVWQRFGARCAGDILDMHWDASATPPTLARALALRVRLLHCPCLAWLCLTPGAALLSMDSQRHYDSNGRRVDDIMTSTGWRKLKSVAAEEGLVRLDGMRAPSCRARLPSTCIRAPISPAPPGVARCVVLSPGRDRVRTQVRRALASVLGCQDAHVRAKQRAVRPPRPRVARPPLCTSMFIRTLSPAICFDTSPGNDGR